MIILINNNNNDNNHNNNSNNNNTTNNHGNNGNGNQTPSFTRQSAPLLAFVPGWSAQSVSGMPTLGSKYQLPRNGKP